FFSSRRRHTSFPRDWSSDVCPSISRTRAPRPAMTDPDVPAMERVLVGEADPEIVSLEARIRAAQLAADVPALDRLIAGELLFTETGSGAWRERATVWAGAVSEASAG